MVITRARANRAAAKAVSTSREKEKRRKSAARTREWRKCQSEEQRSEIHQKQHHVPYSLAISINGTFLLKHGIASALWAFQYVFLIIYFRYFLFLVIFSCPSETVPYLRNYSF
jgi:hypothetical protein